MNTLSHLALPGSTVFFTLSLQKRGSDILVRQLPALREAVSSVRRKFPFRIDAFVVLPDHLHAILTFPPGDTDHAKRWRRIKAEFSYRSAEKPMLRANHIAKDQSGIWQRGYWDHTIRNPADMSLHMAYCWGDPVRHGLVRRAQDWAASSIHRDIRDGVFWEGWTPPLLTGAFGEQCDGLPAREAWGATRATPSHGPGATLH
jgi:putative transposase